MATVGHGVAVSGQGASGVVRRADSIDDVIALAQEGQLADVVLLTGSAAATALIPLLPSVAAVICTTGGRTSHLALVAKELGVTCVMAAQLDDPEGLLGQHVTVSDSGAIDA